ncbi:helix-turn-helix domain-containing protein [Metarhizobium album]|uniref:Helix-turn-helix domain-containing protein n=1 Tax=Metarhizobium album TaxID=2182425 RepID=A0A2U2DHP5_9HYPH|nr:DNA-binding protein [Rhizobium album]PWE52761.1 helix-turn-helix domain-containing protein [Rhizobium album]
MSEPVVWLNTNSICQRYDITKMTVWRWERDEKLKFPQPMVVNGRKLYRQEDIEAWERSRMGGR